MHNTLLNAEWHGPLTSSETGDSETVFAMCTEGNVTTSHVVGNTRSEAAKWAGIKRRTPLISLRFLSLIGIWEEFERYPGEWFSGVALPIATPFPLQFHT